MWYNSIWHSAVSLDKCLVIAAGSDEMILKKASFMIRGEGGSEHHAEVLSSVL